VSAAPAKYLLDTSALFTLLEDEEGADRVQQILYTAQPIICAVSLLEVRYVTLRQQGQTEADVRHALLRRSGADIVWDLDEPTVLRAATFKAKHPLSLADSLIAAIANRHGAILLHKDPEFDVLSDDVRLERLPSRRASRQR
jgi:predicted nucleic acid-binding protein